MEKIQKLSVVLMIMLAGAVIYKPISTRLNENIAIATLKTIRAAQANYKAVNEQYATLDDLIEDGLLPSNLTAVFARIGMRALKSPSILSKILVSPSHSSENRCSDGKRSGYRLALKHLEANLCYGSSGEIWAE